MELSAEDVRGYLDYLRDLGVYDLYRRGAPGEDPAIAEWFARLAPQQSPAEKRAAPQVSSPPAALSRTRPAFVPATTPRASAPKSAFDIRVQTPPPALAARPASAIPSEVLPESPALPPAFAPPSMPIISFNQLAPLPPSRLDPAQRPAALEAIRKEIGDCTRCPLAYAGRHSIVFADGNASADLMFVGEGPGADEDESGVPFVGKAGQLLNNMIAAMGLKREDVYIANIVKCRPPKNRVPEPVEANTCSQFLLRQIDAVQPKVIVALGGTAATYLLGVKQPISALRGQWHDVRGAQCAVTYHPAFLLRDPRQKGEAWKDLQRVMMALGLRPGA